MKKLRKILLIFAAVYLISWGVTFHYAPSALQHQMLREAKIEWQHFHDEQEQNKRPELMHLQGSMAFDTGPVVEVKLLSCPIPFFFLAETRRVIGGLNGSGAEGWFLYTPWHVYDVAVIGTWVS